MEMVVVSSNWVKNVTPYPPSSSAESTITDNFEQDNDNMVAKATLICRPNSHHFQVRTLSLDQPVKVGRSVARAKPASNNAIFDCKVLSRHHALLWYENGKFFLQDTKSSNGTFVNNHKLGEQQHEVSSGDIVQFGVDVVENNRKVTHGCIIATLKLFLPDGKEAKASPSITHSDADKHGMVPLDDLYKLNEIIQEANQREQCLESKLNALQHVVEETRKSAEESWQAYVGEERLLSRLSALETQLQQASKNWTEDRLKDEIAKLRESNEQYQDAAKAALEKVHAERLDAVNLAIEQERSKISAQQDALLCREQLAQAQLEIQDIAQKLSQLQTQREDEREDYEKHIRELQIHVEEEEAKVAELEEKLFQLTSQILKDGLGENDRPELILNDDVKSKEEMLLQGHESPTAIFNKSNQNHINLLVGPVEEECEKEKQEEQQCDSIKKDEEKEVRRVSFILPETEGPKSPSSPNFEDSLEKDVEKEIDSKTLKYQYQSAQKEQHQLRLRIQQLEEVSNLNNIKIEDLENLLRSERELTKEKEADCERLKQSIEKIEDKLGQSCLENDQLKDKINQLLNELELNKQLLEKSKKFDASSAKEEMQEVEEEKITKEDSLNTELEEELLRLKEKYAEISEEKAQLQQDLRRMTARYDNMVDRIQNKFFFYIAPLVFIVMYLLINAWFS